MGIGKKWAKKCQAWTNDNSLITGNDAVAGVLSNVHIAKEVTGAKPSATIRTDRSVHSKATEGLRARVGSDVGIVSEVWEERTQEKVRYIFRKQRQQRKFFFPKSTIRA